MPDDYPSEVPELARKVHSRAAVLDVMQALLYDAEQAHLLLDVIGVPRVIEPGLRELSLANRVTYLHAQLLSVREVVARMTPPSIPPHFLGAENGEGGRVVYKRARVFRAKVGAR